MKRSFSIIPAVLVFAFIITNCKKKETAEESTVTTTTTGSSSAPESGQSAKDNEYIISETDASVNDINNVISNYTSLSGRLDQQSSVLSSVCGMTVDTNGLCLGTVRLDYTGAICNSRKRSGSIQLTIINYGSGVKWKNVGAVLKIDYLNYKTMGVAVSQTIALNGTAYLTNQNGGTWFDLVFLGQPNLIHTYSSSGLLTQLNSLNTYTYNISRQTTYTYSSSVITSSNAGTGNFGTYTNLESYGAIGSGDSVFCSVSNPVVWNSFCGPWSPVSGNVLVKIKSKTYNINGTFGVNTLGMPVTPTSSTCAYGYKIDWTIGSTTSSVVVGYF
jgi:hypothetical protein